MIPFSSNPAQVIPCCIFFLRTKRIFPVCSFPPFQQLLIICSFRGFFLHTHSPVVFSWITSFPRTSNQVTKITSFRCHNTQYPSSRGIAFISLKNEINFFSFFNFPEMCFIRTKLRKVGHFGKVEKWKSWTPLLAKVENSTV